jgi:hypothetical protein
MIALAVDVGLTIELQPEIGRIPKDFSGVLIFNRSHENNRSARACAIGPFELTAISN